MPKDAARKEIIREIQRELGLSYNLARKFLDREPIPFSADWINLDVDCCPVCCSQNVTWTLRGGAGCGPAPQPGDIIGAVSPIDPGRCHDCHASGFSQELDDWDLPRAIRADSCPTCGRPPIRWAHLPWNDGKHRRVDLPWDGVPVDGRWYRYDCARGHWWISAPYFAYPKPNYAQLIFGR